MPLLLILLAALLVLYGPQWWVQRVLARYHRDPGPFPGTGGELARHLLRRFGIIDVAVEPTAQGDHYDPQARAVRLTPDKLDGKTLTAIVTAAHEVGHAIQHAVDYRPFRWRTRVAGAAQGIARAASFLLFAAPLLGMLTRSPLIAAAGIAAAVTTALIGVVVQLLTLPVELDASFNKALPILFDGDYIPPAQRPAARRILRACALTYLAASMASLLNFWTWMRVLRR